MRRLAAVCVLAIALLLVSPSHASGDLFRFEARTGTEDYLLVLAGREDPGAVELSWHGLPRRALQGQSYTLTFDREAQRLVLRYINPGDPARPPSFRLVVTGTSGVLAFDGRRIPGEASWEIP